MCVVWIRGRGRRKKEEKKREKIPRQEEGWLEKTQQDIRKRGRKEEALQGTRIKTKKKMMIISAWKTSFWPSSASFGIQATNLTKINHRKRVLPVSSFFIYFPFPSFILSFVTSSASSSLLPLFLSSSFLRSYFLRFVYKSYFMLMPKQRKKSFDHNFVKTQRQVKKVKDDWERREEKQKEDCKRLTRSLTKVNCSSRSFLDFISLPLDSFRTGKKICDCITRLSLDFELRQG